MFSDLTSNQESYMNMYMVKASPSVNSPNDGSFNSEENARWANKKLATKPFIVGETEQDVAKYFGSDVSGGGYSYYTGDAMFSIDGYLFKLANAGRTSYDYPYQSTNGVGIDCAYIQRFIADLTNYTNDNRLATNYNEFLFSDYVETSLQDIEEVRHNWEQALSTGTVMGYIKNVYTDSYLNELTITGTDVSYGDITVDCSLEEEPSGPDDPIFSGLTQPVGIINYDNSDVESVTIYYPVRLKSVKNYNYDLCEYQDDIRLYFTDIFGLDFVFGTEVSTTRLYPNTENVLFDITENKPLDFISFNDCNKQTYNGYVYNYSDLYEGYTRKSIGTQTHISSNPFSLSSVLDAYTVSQLLQKIPEGVSQQDLPFIKNDLTYYCIKSSEHSMFSNLCLQQQINGSLVDIPVCFMRSDGVCCPDGFIYDESGYKTTSSFPVEGYLHFIKRLYVRSKGLVPTEEAISNVSVNDLCSWTTPVDLTTNDGQTLSIKFSDFYNILYKYICLYFQMGYSCLIDNAVFDQDLASTSFKSYGCGEALSQFSSQDITSDDLLTYQSYTIDGYENNSGNIVPKQYELTISYNKDKSSDSYKVRRSILNVNGISIIGNYKFQDMLNMQLTQDDLILYMEDPINFIKKCFKSSSGQGNYVPSINSVWLYDGSSVVEKIILQDEYKPLFIDDYLFPKISGEYDPTTEYSIAAWFTNYTRIMSNGNTTNSYVNGIAYNFYANDWVCYIPLTISVNKDSLNYLSGKNYLTGKYNGLNFRFVLSNDIKKDELLIFKYKGSSIPKVVSYGIESFNDGLNYSDYDVKTQRESYIHVTKVYDDNNKQLSMVLNEINSDISNIKQIIGESATNLGERVTELENTVNGQPGEDGLTQVVQNLNDEINDETTGISIRLSDVENNLSTVSTNVDGLLGDVGDLQTTVTTLNDKSLRVLDQGILSDPEDSTSNVQYTIYGKSLTQGKNICFISGYGVIQSFDPPWEAEELDDPVISPLIDKNIQSVVIRPGVSGLGGCTFPFTFNDLSIPNTVQMGTNFIGSDSDHINGPKYISIEEGVQPSTTIDVIISNTNISNLTIPKSLFRMSNTTQSSFEICNNESLKKVNVYAPIIQSTGSYKAFENCPTLTTVNLYDTYKIGSNQFKGCIALTTLIYHGTKSQWNNVIKGTDWDVITSEGGQVTQRLQRIVCFDGNLVYDSNTDSWIDEV